MWKSSLFIMGWFGSLLHGSTITREDVQAWKHKHPGEIPYTHIVHENMRWGCCRSGSGMSLAFEGAIEDRFIANYYAGDVPVHRNAQDFWASYTGYGLGLGCLGKSCIREGGTPQKKYKIMVCGAAPGAVCTYGSGHNTEGYGWFWKVACLCGCLTPHYGCGTAKFDHPEEQEAADNLTWVDERDLSGFAQRMNAEGEEASQVQVQQQGMGNAGSSPLS